MWNKAIRFSATGCLFLSLIFSAGCNIINPPEPVPAYIQIDSVQIQVRNGEGSASHKIKDAWVIRGDIDEGVFEIPKRFPILGEGNQKFIISPGILDNGSSETRTVYPFYYPDTLTLNLVPKEIYHINPVIKYRPATVFRFIEDFEVGRVFVKLSGDTNMIVTGKPSEVFEGNGSGKIFLDATHRAYEGTTSFSYNLSNADPSYIEVDYKCDIPFKFGIETTNSSGSNTLYNWIINPKSDWNKLYLNLTDAVQLLGKGEYRILIYTELPRDKSEGTIYLDNIKLLTF